MSPKTGQFVEIPKTVWVNGKKAPSAAHNVVVFFIAVSTIVILRSLS